MPGPDQPDWDFPELAAPGSDPASTQLPEPEPEPIYDTGSDGWWRQQAAAQRAAAERDPQPPVLDPPAAAPLMPPLELVEPEVLNLPTGPSPFEEAYLPAEEVWPTAAAPEDPPRPVLRPLVPPSVYDESAVVPEVVPPVYEAPVVEPVAHEPAPVAYEPVAYEPLRTEEPSFLDEGPAAPEFDAWEGDILPGGGGGRAGVGKALAWAGLAIAGVGLVVVAFLLLNKGDPQGTPTVATPPVVQTTAAVVEPTAEQTAEPTAAPTVEPTTAALAPVVPLTVLNNSKVSHLAEKSGAKFKAGGWPLAGTGNYRGQIDTTTIYYPAGQQASAERFGKQFGVRVLPRFATLPGTGMTVVVTRDFA
ncbi:MAG: hypothetical protein JWM40_36 [Frankiales bacterium]|nr:hypothetical protein [Frankiales bacterium]